jgi:hypothetical protein
MLEYQLSEAFNKYDNVKISSNGTLYTAKVFKQDHQWLHTSMGVFNIVHPDVKIWRIIERYEDQGMV